MNGQPDLGVTLISGRDRQGMRALAAMLLGRAAGGIVGPSDIGPELGSTTDLALALVDQLALWADSGRRGSVVVELDERVENAELGLVLTRVLSDRDPSAPQIAVHDLIAAVSVGDMRRLLFRDGPRLGADDDDSAEHLAGQLEFATAIVLVHPEAASSEAANECLALVRRLNPRAGVYSLSDGDQLVRHGAITRPRVQELGGLAGWMLELSGHAGPPTTSSGISALVFRDPRPFHPGRLAEAVASRLDPAAGGGLILRSRGLVRLASRPDQIGSWATAGDVFALNPTGMESWHEDAAIGQELVLFGRDLHPDTLIEVLSDCLLAAGELIAGRDLWANLADPFPAWTVDRNS